MAEITWQALLQAALAGTRFAAVPVTDVRPLTGGVSSDIVAVRLADGTVLCAKRALAQLKVASVWEAPLERNHFEVAWLRLAGQIVPGVAPEVIAEDQPHGVAVLEYLPPDGYLLWKSEMLAGRHDPAVAPRVASALARIHAATWGDATVAADFATDAMFDALRLDPYLRTLAQRTPDLSAQILAVVETTARNRLALVHGDVSPKNILVSRADGHPVLLDAECAWFGDPAFDAAFCLNHLLLKAVHLPDLAPALLASAREFISTWRDGLPTAAAVEAGRRVAALLPCLFLARVDGKSPVEYLSDAARETVRAIARPLIAETPVSVEQVVAAVEAHR